MQQPKSVLVPSNHGRVVAKASEALALMRSRIHMRQGRLGEGTIAPRHWGGSCDSVSVLCGGRFLLMDGPGDIVSAHSSGNVCNVDWCPFRHSLLDDPLP